MKITRISAALAALVLTFGLAGTALADTYATVDGYLEGSAAANAPSFWGENCEDAGVSDVDSYVLPDIDGVYDQVIVKAGDGEFANTIFDNPAEGETVWADTNGDGEFNPGGQDGDKQISHIIVCTDEAEATPTPTPTPTPEATPTPTPEGSVGGETATPEPTPTLPQTDTLGGPSTPGSASWAVMAVILGGIVATAYVLTPHRRNRQ